LLESLTKDKVLRGLAGRLWLACFLAGSFDQSEERRENSMPTKITLQSAAESDCTEILTRPSENLVRISVQ